MEEDEVDYAIDKFLDNSESDVVYVEIEKKCCVHWSDVTPSSRIQEK